MSREEYVMIRTGNMMHGVHEVGLNCIVEHTWCMDIHGTIVVIK